jgi:hypothetical protein
MKIFFTKLFDTPWYPIAISAYPLLALLAANTGQVPVVAGIRPLLISVLFGSLVFFITWFIFRQTHKAAFLASLFLALFFTFGHAYIYINGKFPDTGYARWLIAVWVILFALSIFWVTRPKLTFISAASIMNTMALALIIMSATQLDFGLGPKSAHALGAEHAPVESNLTVPENPPDVYFFLLDSYGRDDLLKSSYGYDNSPFLDGLRERGFYVAECSQSNYARTELSLSSTLNMMYLQDLDAKFNPENTGRRTLWDSLKHNAARYNFDTMGYETVNFASGFDWLEIRDSDLFISPPAISSGMNEFEGLFLSTTLARYVEDFGWVDADAVMGQSFRDRFNTVFNTIPELAKRPGPQFNYIHLISPHPPFVFDANGNPTNPADFWNERRLYPYDLYEKGYTAQTTYLNKKMLEAIDTILAESDTPPIIIIQGDHGPWLQPNDRHLWILNAIYLPGYEDKLYPSITPINTFRLIFDSYFGGQYDMLKDVSYYSPVPKLYNFTEIPNKCK